ncbi:jg26963 [Pararge aegeria aegeria]|uniref:Jg26963 protein n=1 Tax=Pararge aegeria aegeria TaxID=348720 RepID=A0A8S4RX37_9NEOP|nr:jg26963 [Pararge aegeria aegeria]
MFQKILIFIVLSVVTLAEKVRYDDYSLYKIYAHTEDHVNFLNELQKANDGVHFWKTPAQVGDYASVISSPEEKYSLEHILRKRSIYYDVMVDNIQQAFEDQIISRRKRDTRKQLFWTNFQTMSDIYEWFQHLANTHGDIVSIIRAGQSFEGKNITGVRISRGTARNRPIIFVEGGQIGADWLSPTVITYLVDQLVLGDNTEARRASEDFEWHIFPILNPDGHEFTQNSDRLWLKNRRPTTGRAIGVDLSRNWNSHWGIIGGSFVPEDNNFIGLGPFTEVETRAVSRYIESISSRLVSSLSFRAFGQRLLIPFAHSINQMYNYNDTIIIGRRAMGSLSVRYNTRFNVGTSRAVHDGATGSIADWIKHRFNPPVVFTYQLRDEGTWGYTLPANQVLPSCEETFDSVMAIIREAKLLKVL